MSMLLVTGKPGSGKSLSLVKIWILRNIRKLNTPGERLIYTNVSGLNCLYLSLAANKKYAGSDNAYSPGEIERLFVAVPPPSERAEANRLIMSMPPNSLLIVDEAQKYWNNRDFKDPLNKEILEYFQEHRRRRHDVVLATQNYEQVDIGIRRLVEGHYYLRPMKSLGVSSAISVQVYDNGLEMEKKAGRETWRIDSAVYSCYKSYEVDGNAEIVYKPPNIFLANYKLVFLLIVMLSGLAKFLFFGKKDTSPEEYLGAFEDYFCGRKALYVLRENGGLDTLSAKGIPLNICPRPNFQYSSGGLKK